MVSYNEIIENIFEIPQEYIMLSLTALLIILNIFYKPHKIIIHIIVVTLVLSIFDVFLKKYILLNIKHDFHKFILNNIVSIVSINFLIYLIKNDITQDNMTNLLYIAFSCLFYELIIYKIHSHNSYCNETLRALTKNIMRMATIHILSTYLQDKPFDEDWFINASTQMISILLFNTIFIN